MPSTPITFQEIIRRLEDFWASRGCVIWLPHHEAVGAGTNNPATVLRILGPEPHHIAYVEPSFRPDDGRYGQNPNRVQMHHQMQVIIKPIPHNIQELYLESLAAIGIDYREHDIRFVEDNWESPVLGAWGLGWEVWLDGMEVTQYTYFQQAGALPLVPPACELTYGLERLCMYVQGVPTLWDIKWTESLTYGDLLKEQEINYCRYAFEQADIPRLRSMFELFETEANSALDAGLPVPAYDYVCRCSHTFNLLDTRGAIALSERVKYFGRIRSLTRRCAEGYIAERERLGFPNLGKIHKAFAPPVPPLTPIEEKKGTTERENLVFEVGVEELASFVLDPIQQQLQERLPKALQGARLSYDESIVAITPRRIVISLKGLSRTQHALMQRVKGPTKEAAEKNPKALEGFCKKFGASAQEVRYEEENGITSAFLSITAPQLTVHEVLPALLAELFQGLGTGRAMRWLPAEEKESKLEFNRPIRWLLCLFGEEVLPVEYAGLRAGRTTVGPRWKNSPVKEVLTADEYFSVMNDEKIILDPASRRSVIEQQIQECARNVRGIVKDYDELLDEVTHLVETPLAFVGKLPEQFNNIPGTVKKAIIGKHIRCFPIYAQDGSFLPAFVGVRNGTEEHIDIVRAGFERVIIARLSDAKFFIENDATKRLEDFIPGLEKLMFHEQLGSMREKAERVASLSRHCAQSFALSAEEMTNLERAAYLAKADLASQMVTEMTSLQGEMGALYAEAQGEKKEISEIIRYHYFPRYAGDKIPPTASAQCLSLADKIDTLTAFLSIGLEPTGSADPFALRREALGIVTLLLKADRSLNLLQLLQDAARGVNAQSPEDTAYKVLEFIERRLEIQLREEGLRHDIVRAVLESSAANPAQAKTYCEALSLLVKDSLFREFLPSYTRCVRLVRKALQDQVRIGSSVQLELFTDEIEKTLWHEVVKIKALVAPHDTVVERVQKMQVLQTPITDYFEKVMVMIEDDAVRANRLAVLKEISSLLDEYADLTILEG